MPGLMDRDRGGSEGASYGWRQGQGLGYVQEEKAYFGSTSAKKMIGATTEAILACEKKVDRRSESANDLKHSRHSHRCR